MEVETEKENELPQVILLAELKSILAEYLPNDQLQHDKKRWVETECVACMESAATRVFQVGLA